MTLPALHASCFSILKSIVHHAVGFAVLPSSTAGSSSIENLTDVENALLKQYDRFLQLALERRLLEAEIAAIENGNDGMELDDETAAIEEAKRALTDAKAKVLVKDFVVNATLITRPILYAIHYGKESKSKERDLLPYLQDRDRVSSTLLHLTAQLTLLRDQTDATTSKLLSTNHTNHDLTTKLRQLRAMNEFDTKTERISEREVILRRERRNFDTVRGVVQGIIVGSGVDWAGDERLREVVLECGDVED